MALDLLPLLEKEAKERQRRSNQYRGNGRSAQEYANRNGKGKGKAADTAARMIGVSPRYVELAKEIRTKAPGLVDEIKQGKLTISVAAKLADNEAGRNGRKRHKIDTDDASRILCGDAMDLISTLEDESVQLVVTSPVR